jgi:flagellar protein FliS
MTANPYLKYRVNSIETADPVRLVLMLYQGVLRFTQRGIQASERQEIQVAHESFVRAQAIVAELMSSLNLEAGGEIARNLMALYEYSHRRLVEANCRKCSEPAAEVVELFRELLSAWQTIAEGQTAADAPASLSRIG